MCVVLLQDPSTSCFQHYTTHRLSVLTLLPPPPRLHIDHWLQSYNSRSIVYNRIDEPCADVDLPYLQKAKPPQLALLRAQGASDRRCASPDRDKRTTGLRTPLSFGSDLLTT